MEGKTECTTFEATGGFRSVIQALIKYRESNSLSDTFTLTQTDAVKELISRQFHDNTLDLFISTLTASDSLLNYNGQELEKNQYIINKAPFNIIDLGYVKKFGTPSIVSTFNSMMDLEEENIFSQLTPLIETASLFMPSDIFINQKDFSFL